MEGGERSGAVPLRDGRGTVKVEGAEAGGEEGVGADLGGGGGSANAERRWRRRGPSSCYQPAGSGDLPVAARVATGAIGARRLLLHDHFGSRGKTLPGRQSWSAFPRRGGGGEEAAAGSKSERPQPGACAPRAERARVAHGMSPGHRAR